MTGTLLFGVDGTVVWGRHNFVGSWNDGDTSFRLQMKLIDSNKTAQGTAIVSDSAFPVSQELHGKILTPLKDGDLERASSQCQLALVAMNNAIVSLRQAG